MSQPLSGSRPRSLPSAYAVISIAGAVFASSALAQQPSASEIGVWLDDSQQGAVEIYVCQDRADRLCGRIVWLRDPLNAEGKPKFDRYNPNAALQGRPICGLSVLGNLAKSSDGGFDSGWIYDPKAGKSYSAAIALNGPNSLTVTGYLGMKFMGKSFTWTRAPEGLERCTVAAAAPMKAPAAAQQPAQKQSAGASSALPAAAAASTTGAAAAAAKGTAAPEAAKAHQQAKPKAQPTTTQAAAKQPSKTATAAPKATTATSASPVLTAPPKVQQKKPGTEEAEALPWQKP